MEQNKLQVLINLYFKSKFLDRDYIECVDFALKQLELDNQDINIAVLAGLDPKNNFDIKNTIEKIADTELNDNYQNKEDWVGLYLIELFEKFSKKEIDIIDLDLLLSHLYYKLKYPEWMNILCYNSEYAIDIESFYQPFINEFSYLVEIWKESRNMKEFMGKYSKEKSLSNKGEFIVL